MGATFGLIPPTDDLVSIGLSVPTAPHSSWTTSMTPKFVVVAPGLPSLDRNLVDLILTNQFIDLADLPPARGRTPATNKLLEGHILLVQPADLLQTNLATWLLSICSSGPIKIPRKNNVDAAVSKKNGWAVSQRFRWPSWVIYDNTFRACMHVCFLLVYLFWFTWFLC